MLLMLPFKICSKNFTEWEVFEYKCGISLTNHSCINDAQLNANIDLNFSIPQQY